MQIPKEINFGSLTIHLYGLIIAMAIYIGYELAKIRPKNTKIPPQIFDDPILLVPLVLSIVFARAYHVLDYWSYYSHNPAQIIQISSGGLGIWGAIGGILAGFWIIAKIRKLNLLAVLDLVAPSLLLAQAIGRIGNYINKEGFGPPTRAPWGIFIPPENRPQQFLLSTHFHPTFFYEAIIDALFFVLLFILSRRFKKPGQTFGLYLILYSTGRFAVEFFRIDTATVGTIKIAQVLSVVAILFGVFLLSRKKG